MAVTGPFSKNVTENGKARYQVWYRSGVSNKGYRPVLPYSLNERAWTKDSSAGDSCTVVNLYEESFPDRTSRAYAMAFDRFNSRMGPRVQLAINAIEAGKSYAMLLTRMRQLRRIYTSVVKRDFSGVIRAISDSGGTPKGLSKRHLLSEPSGFWLEIQFGWKPIVQDIFTSVDVLQTQFPSSALKTRGFDESHFETFGVYPTSCRRTVELAAVIRVTNPNLFLANQLGVINPAQVVWDAVPGSFIFDWFLPVGKFLGSFTAFAGVELVDPRVTQTVKGISSFADSSRPGNPNYNFVAPFFGMRRRNSLFETPSVLSRVRLPNVDSWLLATEASLVMQALSRRLK